MTGFLLMLGQPVVVFTHYLGELAQLVSEVFWSIFRHGVRWKLVRFQIVSIGFGSQLQVMVTGAFTGAVFAAQVYYKFNQLGFESVVGGIVALALCRELAPVLTGLMLTSRVGAAMAAEIGTMKVTEQVDALRSLGVHPVDYLVSPRMLAALLSMPILITESILMGMWASKLIVVSMYGVPEAFYNDQLDKNTDLTDLAFGISKGLVFGVLIVLISCHQGLKASRGAVGVGQGTTAAVVSTSLSILVVNFFLTIALNFVWPVARV